MRPSQYHHPSELTWARAVLARGAAADLINASRPALHHDSVPRSEARLPA